MNIVFFILPLALCFAALSVWGFFWAARKGQYDDLDTPPLRILIDEEYIDRPSEDPEAEVLTDADREKRTSDR